MRFRQSKVRGVFLDDRVQQSKPLAEKLRPVEKCVLMVKGDDSPKRAIKQINELPGRIGPPQKEERWLLRRGTIRQNEQSSKSMSYQGEHFSTVPTSAFATPAADLSR